MNCALLTSNAKYRLDTYFGSRAFTILSIFQIFFAHFSPISISLLNLEILQLFKQVTLNITMHHINYFYQQIVSYESALLTGPSVLIVILKS